tara:strand:- start:1224 stop:1691 length:468 start_codon:yes stop_codon:yes gene_type:complete
MRQVSKTSAFTFLDCIVKRTGKNTAITRTGFVETDNKTGETGNSECYYMELHGNPIASLQSFETLIQDNDGWNVKRKHAIHITLAGWNTVTTRERLNALLRILGKENLHIVQHKHQACLATFAGNKRLHHVLNDSRWYDVTELEHIAESMRQQAQ